MHKKNDLNLLTWKVSLKFWNLCEQIKAWVLFSTDG